MTLSRSKGFEKLFGFPPPQGKRGPGSRPIGWDRKDKVLKVLRALAYKVERARRMRQDAADSQLPAGAALDRHACWKAVVRSQPQPLSQGRRARQPVRLRGKRQLRPVSSQGSDKEIEKILKQRLTSLLFFLIEIL